MNKQEISESVLDPVSRATEILFGLIMVLSFTSSISVAEAGQSDVREMLRAALGCNIAWGIIDGYFYLLNIAAQRRRERKLVEKLAEGVDSEGARELYQNIIPESIIGSLSPNSLIEIRNHLLANQHQRTPLITIADLKAALVVFVLVFLTTFPVALPFLVISSNALALRLSNLIAILLLAGIGYSLGHYASHRPWLCSLMMIIVGVGLVTLTIALGG